MSNCAYALLWGADPAGSLDDASLRSLSGHWRSQSAASAVWNDLEDFASNQGDRAVWRAEARLLDGRLIDCRFAPLAAGATLTGFRIREVAGAAKTLLTDKPGLLRA